MSRDSGGFVGHTPQAPCESARADICSSLRDALRARLSQPLPGREAHRRAWPDHLPGAPQPAGCADLIPAAVLIALHPDRACRHSGPHGAGLHAFRIPLIQRPDDQRAHAGQVALPGGVVEQGESVLETALREADEEIGLDTTLVEPLGLLTPVDVHVTGFRVHPVVGWVQAPPCPWSPRQGEVEEIYGADPDQLLGDGPSDTLSRVRGGIELNVPAYRVPHARGSVHVWGATAIILAEFLVIWAHARSAGAVPTGPFPGLPDPSG